MINKIHKINIAELQRTFIGFLSQRLQYKILHPLDTFVILLVWCKKNGRFGASTLKYKI